MHVRYKFILILILLGSGSASGQIIYFNNTAGNVFTLNIETCTATQISNGPAFNDMAVGENGLVYGLFGQTIYELNPATGTSTTLVTIPGALASGLEYGVDGHLYMLFKDVWKINPTNGAWQLVGSLPSGWSVMGDLVYFDGNYYASCNTPAGPRLCIINLNNPGASTIVDDLPPGNIIGGASVDHPTCPKMYWFSTTQSNQPSVLYEYEITTQTWTPICPGFPFTVGGADSPNDYSFQYTCACATDAGNVTAQTFNLCGTSATATVPYTGGAVLDNDDILRYVLFSDPNDPGGSILVQSPGPEIAFNPANMQTGVTYYIGTAAGNALNNNVDLSDPCLDFADTPAAVVWHVLPSVSFSTNNTDVCPGDCRIITVSFSGSPPFALDLNTPTGSAFITSADPVTLLSVCFGQNEAPGPFLIEAISLSDAFCVCD